MTAAPAAETAPTLPTTMRALSKLHPREGLWMTEAPVPTPGPNDLLIRVRRGSICGTDVHIYKWDAWAQKTIPVPMIVGHEYVGVVAAVGSEVRGFSVGDRVSGEGHVTCGHCRNCRAGRRHLCRNTQGVGVNRPGSFAEYLVLPAFNAFKIPDDIPDDVAAIFDPFGNAVHTALSFDLVGEDVLITGAGPIGVMAAAVAKHVGARNVVITDVNDYRLDLACKMGVTRAVNVAREDLWEVAQTELGMTEGFDVGLEMSGSGAALAQMVDVMNNGGKIALLGIPAGRVDIDWNAVIFKMLTIKGIYGREMFETWYKMVALIQSGLDLTPVLTHRFPIGDYQRGFDAMLSGQSGKVILDWEAVKVPHAGEEDPNPSGEARMTARIRILTAFRDLERELGRTAFTLAEVAGRVPQYARGTVGAHLSSFMADGKNHATGYGEVERVEHGLYRLTAKGRHAQRALGLLAR